ncbi:MAG TPA: universal stress protein, partial [Chitinophagaceae bacterium]|nr:universal stress protein [Chitinophagaceae bacterium]
MKTIIIPTDFSPVATNAMHFGIDMAKSIGASVILLHVYQVPVSYTDTPIVLISVEELKKEAEQKLKKLQE